MRAAFLTAVKELRSRLNPDRLEELLQRGDQGNLGAFWQAFEAEVGPALREPIREGVMQAGQRTAAPLGMAFDLTNPKALDAIERHGAQLVREITTESRGAIRAILRQGFSEGVTVDEMARRIRSSIGLTSRQAQAVENFRAAQLDAGVDEELVQQRADAYARRLLSQRATNIARTETIAAASRGQQAAWESAQAEGELGAASVSRLAM